jgi:hypothetical protein
MNAKELDAFRKNTEIGELSQIGLTQKALEHIDSQAGQIAVLKAALLAEKTRFGLGRKRVVLAELAQEFPAIFGEDVNE